MRNAGDNSVMEKQHINALAIQSIRTDAQFGIADTYSTLKWFDWNKEEKPTEKEFDDAVTAWKANYDAQEYARKRQAEYPSIEELVVALYDTDDKADIEAKRAEVKKKYPKPE